MKTNAKSSLAALALLATLGLGASGAAQAHGDDIFWSIGMSQPGIQVGVSNAPPMPVYVPARPVYVPQPQVIYVPPQPVYRAVPVYYGRGYGWGHRGWEERHERYEHGGYERRGYEGRGYEGRGYEGRGGYEGRSPEGYGRGEGRGGGEMHIGRR